MLQGLKAAIDPQNIFCANNLIDYGGRLKASL
jgi:hypothetical protein